MTVRTIPGLLIGGVASGCGKTTVTLAMMAALRRCGRVVQSFKVGPDYIDPGLHRLITGRSSWNLDGWMGSRAEVLRVWEHVTRLPAHLPASDFPDFPDLPDMAPPDIAVVEGVMGLFDGASGHDNAGSSAEIAAWLNLPVILVVDARGMARSIAALVGGYAHMGTMPSAPAAECGVRIAGVICTRVNSANHRALLTDALTSCLPHIPLLGCLPTDPAAELPSRHLGLVTAEDAPLSPDRVNALASWFMDHTDLAAIERLAAAPPSAPVAASVPVAPVAPVAYPASPASHTQRPVRIAVASDAAFCFIYPALHAALRTAGATLLPFSPLTDTRLPACDALWLPGGYPELHAARLAANTSLRQNILCAVAGGLLVHGECGGYIWLADTLQTPDGVFSMLGCLPLTMQLRAQRASLGYRAMRMLADGPFGPAGTYLRGHEFHYAALVGTPAARYAAQEQSAPLWITHDRTGRERGPEGWKHRRVSGSWVHLYPGSAPDAVPAFVAAARLS